MNRKRRRKGWLSVSLKSVLTSARTSVIVTVALLPSLMTQIFSYYDTVEPATWIAGILAAMLILFLFLLYLESRAQLHEASGFLRGALSDEQLDRVTGVVTVVANMDKPGVRAVQTLIRGLPNLVVLHAVLCEGDDAAVQLGRLRGWCANQGRDIEIRSCATVPDRLQFDEAIAMQLGNELGFIHDSKGTIVDVTGDTALITLTLYLAAAAQRLPVTYIPSTDRRRPGRPFSLSTIRDPEGLFTT